MDDLESTEISDITDALGLWRRLVSGAVGRPLPSAVAVDAFRRVHRGGESGAFDSALLLCTDWRWRRVSAPVLAGILESGLLDDDGQDRLADTLLWQERVRYRHPFGGSAPASSNTSSTHQKRAGGSASTPTLSRLRTAVRGRRCGPGLLATFCVEAELQPTTSSNTHGRCRPATRQPS